MTLALGCTFCDVSAGGVTEFTDDAQVSASAYDALNSKGRRRGLTATTQHEDRHLPQEQRRQLIGGMRDLRRNSSLLDWMIRQHLNYICEHRFQSATNDDPLDDEIEAMMAEEFTAANFDERQVFDLTEYIQTQEAMAVVDGDCGTLFVDADGGRVQGIEADRIRNPNDVVSYFANLSSIPGERWYNGVRTTESGRPLEYAIHRRLDGFTAFEFERRVQAANFYLHAYRTRFDQQRGVSPIATAYNQLRDVYEAEEYAIIRSKVTSMFAMAIMRNATSAAGQITHEVDADGNPIMRTYNVDFGRGPVFLDMDQGDDVKFLDSSNPGSNLQDFWRFVTQIALKSLDLPYGLFDESVANFFGNKTAWLSYDRSCRPKRRRVRYLLDSISKFKLRQLIRRKRLTLPRGRTLETKFWNWVPRGMPWWRPLEEVTANLKAIGGGLTTPQRVCIESDQGDFYENIDAIAKAREYAAEKGMTLSWDVDAETANQVYASRGKSSDDGKQKVE